MIWADQDVLATVFLARAEECVRPERLAGQVANYVHSIKQATHAHSWAQFTKLDATIASQGGMIVCVVCVAPSSQRDWIAHSTAKRNCSQADLVEHERLQWREKLRFCNLDLAGLRVYEANCATTPFRFDRVQGNRTIAAAEALKRSREQAACIRKLELSLGHRALQIELGSFEGYQWSDAMRLRGTPRRTSYGVKYQLLEAPLMLGDVKSVQIHYDAIPKTHKELIDHACYSKDTLELQARIGTSSRPRAVVLAVPI